MYIPKCEHMEMVGDGPIFHHETCGEDAEMVILFPAIYEQGSDPQGDFYVQATWSAYCAGHAPEEVHEVRQSFHDDEFRIVVVNKVEG